MDLVYVELHSRDSEQTNIATLRRALAFFAEQGPSPPKAVMTDEAMVYRRSRRFAPSWRPSAPATSSPLPTRRAGRARSSA